MAGITQGRQVFEIDVDELTRPLFFEALGLHPRRSRQLIDPLRFQYALDGALPEPQCVANPGRTLSPSAQGQDARFEPTTNLRGRRPRPATARAETGEIVGLVARPPTRQHCSGDPEVGAQRGQSHALLVHCHQLGSKHWVVGHTTHTSPPCDRILRM